MFFYYPSYTALGNSPNPTACGLGAIIRHCIPSIQKWPLHGGQSRQSLQADGTLTPRKPNHSPHPPAAPAHQLPTNSATSRRETARVLVSARGGSWERRDVRWESCTSTSFFLRSGAAPGARRGYAVMSSHPVGLTPSWVHGPPAGVRGGLGSCAVFVWSSHNSRAFHHPWILTTLWVGSIHFSKWLFKVKGPKAPRGTCTRLHSRAVS